MDICVCFYLGSGKTPSCNIGSINLIIHYLKPELGQTLLIDETSTNGLFDLMSSSASGFVPNICVYKAFKALNVLSLLPKTLQQVTPKTWIDFVNHKMATTCIRSKEAKPSASVHH